MERIPTRYSDYQRLNYNHAMVGQSGTPQDWKSCAFGILGSNPSHGVYYLNRLGS
jgi:hypothetical protein